MFIFREKDLTATSIVKMEGNKTSITNMKVPPSKHTRRCVQSVSHPPKFVCFPKSLESITGESMRDRVKTFTYDFSYDSSDCKISAFVSQEKVNKRLSPAEGR